MGMKVELNRPEVAVIYARYSSHSQGEQSIEGQLAAAHAYAAAHGYTVAHEYIDRAKTGRNDNRDEFQQMLHDTAKQQFQVVICWKVDRFGRNREEITFNKHLCRKNGVRVEYVAENLPDSPESVILESVLEGMAEYYSLQLSQNIRRGMMESAKKGQAVGGKCPLGYTIRKDTHMFEVDPKTAPVVKTIFSMYAQGSTIREIIRYLNDQGIRTSKGGPFTQNSLNVLLKNEKYIGIYKYKDVRHEDKIPPIVDRETFDKVQEMLKINRRAPASKWSVSEYILTGKLFCGHCGGMMVGKSGNSRGVKYCYYICRGKDCHKKPVKQEVLERAVIEHTLSILDDQLLDEIAEAAWQYYQAQDETANKREAIERQLADVDKALANVMRAIEMGIINATTKARMDELDQQKADLTAALADLEITSSLRLTKDHILYFLHQFRDANMDEPECCKRLIQTFVNCIYVYDDKLRIGFNIHGGAEPLTHEIMLSLDSEGGSGFARCAFISTITRTCEPIIIVGRVFVLTFKKPGG